MRRVKFDCLSSKLKELSHRVALFPILFFVILLSLVNLCLCRFLHFILAWLCVNRQVKSLRSTGFYCLHSDRVKVNVLRLIIGSNWILRSERSLFLSFLLYESNLHAAVENNFRVGLQTSIARIIRLSLDHDRVHSHFLKLHSYAFSLLLVSLSLRLWDVDSSLSFRIDFFNFSRQTYADFVGNLDFFLGLFRIIHEVVSFRAQERVFALLLLFVHLVWSHGTSERVVHRPLLIEVSRLHISSVFLKVIKFLKVV